SASAGGGDPRWRARWRRGSDARGTKSPRLVSRDGSGRNQGDPAGLAQTASATAAQPDQIELMPDPPGEAHFRVAKYPAEYHGPVAPISPHQCTIHPFFAFSLPRYSGQFSTCPAPEERISMCRRPPV